MPFIRVQHPLHFDYVKDLWFIEKAQYEIDTYGTDESGNLKGIRLSDQQISHGIYNDPSTSIRTEVDQTTSPISKTFTRVKLQLIEDIYYHEIKRSQKITFFCDWFTTWYPCPQYIISNKEDFTKIWVKPDGTEVQFVHLPPESLHLTKGSPNSKPLEANAFAHPTNQITDVNLVIKHNNWTNTSLQMIGNQLNRIEDHIQRTNNINIDTASTSSSTYSADIKPTFLVNDFKLSDSHDYEFVDILVERLKKLSVNTLEKISVSKATSDDQSEIHIQAITGKPLWK
ncbi:hypothetical protein GIB67_038534 [Kingdonia uniflora]|uniref:DUF7588 domain-containing protein n=1 Tax=Kingdonia uniflora TaxID=39325 RepID=A0A7J7NP97_9MAGN|nr:hypothetical protein GIB67_038534 [Kingdonia uniflora]